MTHISALRCDSTAVALMLSVGAGAALAEGFDTYGIAVNPDLAAAFRQRFARQGC
jgi:hypothetical protein